MKSYTNIEQSKKLAEILPTESADMRFCFSHTLGGRIKGHYPMIGREPSMGTIPCWSLAALLALLPKEINVLGTIYSIDIHTKNEEWFIDYKCNNEEFVGVCSNNFVDTCVKLILKLKEKNLL